MIPDSEPRALVLLVQSGSFNLAAQRMAHRRKEVGEAEVIPVSVIREMFKHNYWARDLQLQACAALTPEQLARPLGNSFSSVQETLGHLLGAEWIWLERWQGRSPTMRDTAEFASELFVNLSAIEECWRVVESDMSEYLSSLSEDRLTQQLTYVSVNGETWTYPLWRTLFHLINHQTYHRGQITTMLRQIGIQPPQIDFLVAHDVNFRARDY